MSDSSDDLIAQQFTIRDLFVVVTGFAVSLFVVNEVEAHSRAFTERPEGAGFLPSSLALFLIWLAFGCAFSCPVVRLLHVSDCTRSRRVWLCDVFGAVSFVFAVLLTVVLFFQPGNAVVGFIVVVVLLAQLCSGIVAALLLLVKLSNSIPIHWIELLALSGTILCCGVVLLVICSM